MKKRKPLKLEDFILDLCIYIILIFLTVVTFYPMWYVVVASFSTGTDLAANPGIILWPKNITIQAYKLAFGNRLLMNGFKNTLIILGMSLPINIVLTLFCGYFLSRTNLKLKKPITAIIMFTMFFSGGLVPGYLNMVDLGLINTYWAIVLSGAMSVYNAIICKTAIEGVPDSLTESAKIDGASDFTILFRIIVPLIKPTLAVLLLYYAVGHWNSWFSASIYLKDDAKLPMQNIMRAFLLENSDLADAAENGGEFNTYAEAIKYAGIVITTAPILCVYPFLQKHFTKGVMVGAVKG